MSETLRPRRVALQLLGLWAFALLSPMAQVLHQNGEFFVARRVQPLDLAVLLGVWCVLLPALVVGPVLLLRRWPRLYLTAYGLAFSALAGLFALPLLVTVAIAQRQSPPYWTLALAAGAVGVGTWALAWRTRFVSEFLSLLSVGMLIFPGVMLLSPEVRQGVFQNQALQAHAVGNKATVVVLIFDELSLPSLLDEGQQIDPAQFPGFARLAATSTWYRRATTVYPQTSGAVPALLTGCYPVQGAIPNLRSYPRNLFTLLGATHRNRVEEVYRLCPDQLVEEGQAGYLRHLSGMFRDAWLATRMRVIPDLDPEGAYTQMVWEDMLAGTGFSGNRRQDFERYLGRIDRNPTPTLYFYHMMLPHSPYVFLPSGQSYAGREGAALAGNVGHVWGGPPHLVDETYQRYLLQVDLCDRLVGELLDRLEACGILKDALVVVTSDHGVVFRHGEKQRGLDGEDPTQVLSVPLFIKAPGQTEGRVSDAPAELVDVLPTLEDLLQVAPGWDHDGFSLQGPVPREAHLAVGEDGRRRSYPVEQLDPARAIRDRLRLFPRPDRFWYGPRPEQRGQKLSEVPGRPAKWELSFPERYQDVRPESDFLPCRIQGTLQEEVPPDSEVSVAVNGVVWGTTWVYRQVNGRQLFSLMVPPGAFRKGKNRIEVRVRPGRS